ncbi:MAG TPA: cupin domain-containing protein [Candidatus Aquilonibacter sp.]
MRRILGYAGIAAVSFAFGLSISHMPLARAAAAPLQAQAVDLLAITPDAMPTPTATFPNLRTKTLVVTDGMTAALQMGTAPKHYHANANEVQFVLAGTGTEWLGDKQVPLQPGMMIVIPAGTNHAGLVDTSGGKLRFVSIKTPPQAPTDVHFVQ